MFPDFLCIGAQKAGTTWLYKNLRHHREIWLPPIKEIHYFDHFLYHQFPFSKDFNRDGIWFKRFKKMWIQQFKLLLRGRCDFQVWKWGIKFFFKTRTLDWYSSIFEPGKGRRTGDITPAYSTLSLNEVAYVKKVLPGAKIVFFMRNPIDRAWSSARMALKREDGNWGTDIESFALKIINSQFQLLRGNYLRTLKNWQSYYSKECFFIGFFEELSACPEDLLLRLYKFLGVSSSDEFIPKEIRNNVNPSMDVLIPPKIAVYLANMYYDDIKELNKLFGGYTKSWLEKAEIILNSKY